MSRFSDFDDFLKDKTSEQHDWEASQIQKRLQSRKKLDPFIKFVFAVFGDYLKTIIEPRTTLIAVPKNRENPSTPSGPIPEDYTYYEYIVNLIYKDRAEWPYPMNKTELQYYGFEHEGTIEYNNTGWHPNVAFQFSLGLLEPPLSESDDMYINLKPRILMRVWGSVDPEHTKKMNVGVSYNDTWRKLFSNLWMLPEPYAQKFLENQLIDTFKLLTPFILAHRDFWKY